MQLGKTALLSDITSNIYTNVTKNIKGNTSRDRFINLMDSTLNKADDANANNGYMAIDSSGIADITKIKSLSPAGKFLKDDGSWDFATISSALTTGHIPYQDAANDLANTPLQWDNTNSKFILPNVIEFITGSTALWQSSSGGGYYIGWGNDKDLSNATYYTRQYFGDGDWVISVTDGTSGSGSIEVSPNFNRIQALDASNNFTRIDQDGGSIVINSNFTSFTGLNYSIVSAGYVNTHQTAYSLLHRAAGDARYAPIVSGGYLPLSGAVSMTGNYNLYADASSSMQPVTFQQLVAYTNGLYDLRGGYNASTNLFPAIGGSGTAGAINKADVFIITVAGTLGTTAVLPGDEITSLVDSPGQTPTNWNIVNHDLGYTPITNVLTAGYVLVGNGSNIATGVAISGDITINTSGVTAIGNSKVLNAMIDTVAWSKITSTPTTISGYGITDAVSNSLLSTKIYVGNGSNIATAVNISGDATISNTGALTVASIGGKTVSLAGNFTMSGAYNFTGTLTNTTAVTFPTTGTLATLAGAEALTNKTYNGNTWTAGSNTLTLGGNFITSGAYSFTGTLTGTTTVTFPTSGTLAIIGNPLSQFASTTSAQFAGVISNATGSAGFVVLSISPTFTGTPILATPTLTSAAITGTTGNGYFEFLAQSSNVAAPSSSGFRLFAGATGSFNWAQKNGTDTYVRTFDATLTADRTYTLQDSSDTIVMRTTTDTLSNKRYTPRTGTTASSATPTINTDNVDRYTITALAAAITSFTTNLSGTPVDGDLLEIRINDNGTARAITWGTSFASTTLGTLPTTTVISTTLRILLEWNSTTSKWECLSTN